MARLVEEVVTVKFSKLVKDTETDVPEMLSAVSQNSSDILRKRQEAMETESTIGDNTYYTVDLSKIPNVTLNVPPGASGSGSTLYTTAGSNGSSYSTWGNLNSTYTISSAGNLGVGTTPSLHVTGAAHFDDDVYVKGKDLKKLMEKIEQRLSILLDPDPKKLEKYEALKKAYQHYKTLEALIGDD